MEQLNGFKAGPGWFKNHMPDSKRDEKMGMRAIRLLKPKHLSQAEEPQVFLWPHAAQHLNLTQEQTMSQPAFSYFFSWEPVCAPPEDLGYELTLSLNSNFTETIIRKKIEPPAGPLPEANILNLRISTRYYWKVTARSGKRVVAKSPVRSFTTDRIPPRWIYVPGMYNVRDMGGWPLEDNRRIRQGLIYRSSELAGSSWKITSEGRRILLEDLKIKTDLDLRGESSNTRPILDQSAVRWINIPVRAYDILKDSSPESYCDVFKVFAEPDNFPIIFHCQGGCDRGGTVAFLLHALLGLEKEPLLRDYELSCRASARQDFQSLIKSLADFSGGQDSLKMQAANYLQSSGVSAKKIKSIRANLIEKITR